MIIALSGPSGIGKGYAKEAIKKIYPDVQEVVWYTTRELRKSEQHNSNRKHISEPELEKLETKGEVALVQGIFGNRYAVKKQDLLEKEGIFLTEIHPYVVVEAKSINPNIVMIGLVTEDISLLEERLTSRRKTETPEEIKKRIALAKAELKAIQDNLAYYDEIISIARDNEHLIAQTAQNMFLKIISDRG